MLAPQSQSATRLYFSSVTSRRVMGPFWGTASILERAGLDFHLQLERFWKISFGIGNGKTSFPFLLNDKQAPRSCQRRASLAKCVNRLEQLPPIKTIRKVVILTKN